MIATLAGAGGGGRSLVLNGHIDVVSPEPASWWSADPFSGHVDGGRLIGRGAYDMKGGLVAALWALEAVLAAGSRCAATVRFESVIEEECTGNGALAARARCAARRRRDHPRVHGPRRSSPRRRSSSGSR